MGTSYLPCPPVNIPIPMEGLWLWQRRSENPISERRAGDGKNNQNPPRPEGYKSIG